MDGAGGTGQAMSTDAKKAKLEAIEQILSNATQARNMDYKDHGNVLPWGSYLSDSINEMQEELEQEPDE